MLYSCKPQKPNAITLTHCDVVTDSSVLIASPDEAVRATLAKRMGQLAVRLREVMVVRGVNHKLHLIRDAHLAKHGAETAAEVAAEFLTGAVEIPADSRLRHAHDLGDFVDVEAFEVF